MISSSRKLDYEYFLLLINSDRLLVKLVTSADVNDSLLSHEIKENSVKTYYIRIHAYLSKNPENKSLGVFLDLENRSTDKKNHTILAEIAQQDNGIFSTFY